MYDKNNQPTTIKQAAINFDIFIRDGGIGTSMFFVLILLIIVNAHSLHFLFGDGVLSWIFSIIGSLGFSIATTSVIRKPVSKWMKYSFPLFDTILVFLGFNILSTDIPVRLIMIILFSLFLGAIILSLGIINLSMHKKEEKETNYKSKIKKLLNNIDSHLVTINNFEKENSELKDKLSDYEIIKFNRSEILDKLGIFEKENSELKLVLSDFENLKIENKENNDKLELSLNELAEKNSLLAEYENKLANYDTYQRGYLLYHAGRIRKKNQENYTDDEKEIMRIVEGMGE